LINHKIEILRAQTWWCDKWKVLLWEPFDNVEITYKYAIFLL